MNAISRKDFLKTGAALPLALQSLDLRAAADPSRQPRPSGSFSSAAVSVSTNPTSSPRNEVT